MRIDEQFLSQVQQTPHNWAVKDEKQRMSYQSLYDAVMREAEQLHHMDVQPGDVVALLRPNDCQWLAQALAVLYIGGILMPVHPDLTSLEREKLLSLARPKNVIIVDGYQKVRAYWKECESEKSEIVNGKSQNLKSGGSHVGNKEIFYLGFTSGSSGNPKGLVKTHDSWLSSFAGWQQAFSLTCEERILVPLHLSYSAQLYAALQGLCMGAEVILLHRFSPKSFLQTGASCAIITPACIEPLLRNVTRYNVSYSSSNRNSFYRASHWEYQMKKKPLKGNLKENKMPKKVISVGNKLAVAQRTKFELALPNCLLYEYYGSSEMGYVSLLTPEDAQIAPETVGVPFPGVEVAFFDENGKTLPLGKPGKLYAKTEQAFLGYVGRPEETARAFLGEWVTSHDIGYQREDGRIVLLGRDRDVIKSGGSLVYAGEVEETLMKISGIREAVVFPAPDPKRGEILCAAIVLESGKTLQEVQKQARKVLASFKQPRMWKVLSELPKNHNGKVDKKRLIGG